jgi:NAD(P)-dependent dehydrogenase (short-subunit alcohol dehydrogenase family)
MTKPEVPAEATTPDRSLLSDKVAIVTGGGSGMGRELAMVFASHGAHVAVASNEAGQNDEVTGTILQAGGSATSVWVDVADPESVAAMVAGTVARWEGVDILVNAAAVGQGVIAPEPGRRRLADLDWEGWSRLLAVNVGGTFLACRAVIPAMKSRGGGSIINFSSGTVRFPLPDLSAYTTSKWAVEGLTKVLALEVESEGIRVNCLQPGGPVDTPLLFTELSREHRAHMHQASVIRSAGVWLASEESRLITGRSIVAVEWNKERGIADCPCPRCTTRDPWLALEWRGAVAL